MPQILPVKFSMSYKMSFHRHSWTSCLQIYVEVVKWQKIRSRYKCHKDDHDESSMYGNHAIGVYKQENDSTLVSHVPI